MALDPPVDASFVIASVFKELAANNRGPGGHVGKDALLDEVRSKGFIHTGLSYYKYATAPR